MTSASSSIGWALAAAAVAAGTWQWGWRGLVLALTLVVFWLLLQFGRALRAMRQAASAPVGHVHSAVMLHAKLRLGLSLVQILGLTGSLGHKHSEMPEQYLWTDAGGDRLRVTLTQGRLSHWTLERATDPPTPHTPPGSV